MKGLCGSLDLGVITQRCGGERERREGEEQQGERNNSRHGCRDECGRWREGQLRCVEGETWIFSYLGLIEAEGTCRTDGDHRKGRTTMLRKCAQRGKEADRRRIEWCWLGDITLMQNTSIILQTCSLALVLGSTCILGSGSWGPSLLGSSLTSLWDTSLMWLPTAARLNFKTQQVFFWSYSQSCSPISFEHFPAVCLIVTSSLTPFELSRTRLLLCFWGYFLSFQNHKHLQTKYEKLTEIRKLCQTWLEKTSIS